MGDVEAEACDDTRVARGERCGANLAVAGAPSFSAGGGDDSGSDNAVVIGVDAKAMYAGDSRAVVIGRGAIGWASRDIAIGDGAFADARQANYSYAIAVGNDASAIGGRSLALGDRAQVRGNNDTHFNGTALGAGAVVSAQDSVALGADTVADREHTVSVGNARGGRQLVNLANGTLDTDAVNLGQLKVTARDTASIFGGRSVSNPDGSITAPTYWVQGGSYRNVGDALGALDTGLQNIDERITSNFDSINHNQGGINRNANEIDDLRDMIGDAMDSLVRQEAATGDLTVGADTAGNVVNLAGTAGSRRLTGVANGMDDTDAVTIAQLKAAGVYDPVEDRLLSALVYDDIALGRATLGGTQGTVIANLAGGLIAQGSMEAINGGQLFDAQAMLQGQIDGVLSQVDELNQRVAEGGVGGVSGPITDNGGGVLGNIGDGVASGDAVNVGQLTRQTEEAIRTANAYTDEKVAAVQRDLDGFKQQVDRRFQRLDARISRVGAMSAAYAQMAFSTQGIDSPNRLGVGVGTQGGRHALAMGYSRRVAPNVSLSLGGSASGSEASGSVGVGIGW